MDERLQLICYLYGEDVDASALEQRLLEDDALRREYERLRATKEQLDDVPSHRPDPTVVDEIVSRAGAPASARDGERRPAADRGPQAPRRSWSRRLQAISAGLALVLVIALGWWRLPANESTSSPAVSSQPTSTADPAQQTPQRRDVASTGELQNRDDEVPSWDDSEELIRIHRNIERLQARSAPNQWGTLQTVEQSRP